MNTKIEMIDVARLRWACRRGMLELDVLLGNFLNEAYSALPLAKQQDFVALLAYSDPELLDALMGRAVLADARMATMSEMIRQHALSRI